MPPLLGVWGMPHTLLKGGRVGGKRKCQFTADLRLGFYSTETVDVSQGLPMAYVLVYVTAGKVQEVMCALEKVPNVLRQRGQTGGV